MRKIHYSTLLSCFFVLGSCIFVACERLDMSGMFWPSSAGNDERFAQSMAYNEEHGYKTISVAADEYKVYFASDFHIDSTTLHTEQWVRAIQHDNECVAAISLGDMVNGREKYPYLMAAMAPLLDASFPLFTTAGNHDIYFGEWPEYVKYWGTSTYYFTVQTPVHKDLYISLDSSDGTIGVDQLSWLRTDVKKLINEGDYRHIIVFTHTHMFKPDGSQGTTGNYPMEETYELLELFDQMGIEWYVSGHRHARDIRQFRKVIYYTIDAIQESYPDNESYYMVASIGSTLQATFVSIAE